MPKVFVYGIPPRYSQGHLERMLEEMRTGVASISELNVNREQVFVFFPADRCTAGLGQEILVYIDLFDLPARTDAVLKRLREECGRIVRIFFKTAYLEVCAIRTNRDRDVTFLEADIYESARKCDGPSCPVCSSETYLNSEKTEYECTNCGEKQPCHG